MPNHRFIWILSLLILSFSLPAEAYIRTQTCDPTGFDERRLCRPGQIPKFVQWGTSCLTLFINKNGSDDFPSTSKEPHVEVLAAIQQSMDQWNNVSCSNMKLLNGGLTCNRNIGKAQREIRGGQMNTILWQESFWNHSKSAIALTTVNFNRDTGIIVDSDIEMNGFHYRFANLDDESQTHMDIRNTLVHELGHLLGLDHELETQDATMFPSANTGEIYKRTLEQDDIDGLCTIYPNQGIDLICEPLQLEDNTCTVNLEGEAWCGTTQSSVPVHIPWPLVLFGLVGVCTFGALRRRDIQPTDAN